MIDLDGTLVDTMGDFDAVVALMLKDLGLPALERVHLEGMVGKGSEHLIESVLKRQKSFIDASALPPSKVELHNAWQIYQAHYQRVNGQASAVYPGVMAGLEGLATLGLPMACLTNKPTAFAKDLLARKGLSGFFGHVYGGDAFPRKKPDPMPLLETCKTLGTLPSRTLMLGDSQNDAQAARAAACPVVLVTYGYNHGEPIRGVDCDGFIDRFTQLQI